jgi:signal transduction histidine kinase
LLNEQQPGSAGGTGIGLQIAMHAARAQGGDLAVESSPGHGSLFSLRVPREVAARTPNRSAS